MYLGHYFNRLRPFLGFRNINLEYNSKTNHIMRTKINLLASAVMVLLLMACGNSQKDTGSTDTLSPNGLADSDGTAGNYYSRDPGTNDRMLENSTGNEKQHTGINTSNTTMQQDPNTANQNPNDAFSDYDRQRNQELYSNLKMTDEQIQKYENASRSSLDTWKRDNPNKTMSAQDRVKVQNDNLRSVLDDNQYRNYEKWSADNPYRN